MLPMKVLSVSNTLKLVIVILLLYISYELYRTHHLYYPDYLFDHHTIHRNFEIYSDRPPPRDITDQLDEVTSRLEKVDGYNAENRYSIYLIHNTPLFARFTNALGMSQTIQALTVHPLGYILINLPAVERTADLYGSDYPRTLYTGDPAHIIAHELTHAVMTEQLGFITSWQLPEWKSEGYAEYGASRHSQQNTPSSTLADRAGQYLEGYYDRLSPRQQSYIRSGLLIEYLIEVKGWNFHTLMNEAIDPDTVLSNMEEWYRAEHEEVPATGTPGSGY